ncbi:PLP-dependent aminotransferase family protein [Cognatishimia sp. F0-27]|uniref:aminotransferase-like domain-containing protein n=1 Tax=Cognatishimia sp. F0-27 TaxID=2816855 RepID=UPI001D0C0DC7|nr:PLP-dependent aminotransferase family protein [Cognatishimia sp. F0-27]MCC1493615.1 PLP-dependent aminotransferase family protein [Cognatishimia sp. F0-27]
MDTISDLYETQGAAPKYKAVAAAIRNAVSSGALRPGDKLPPVRDLAWRLGITPGTVARAYTLLTESGEAAAAVGRGTFVATPKPAPATQSPDLRVLPQDTDTVTLFSARLPDVGQVAMIRKAMGRLGETDPDALLNYPTRESFEPARRAVLRWLGDTVLGQVDQADLVLSHGGQSAVSLVMQSVLHGPRPVVMLEELSYPGFRRAAQLLRADVVSVAMDADGLCPESLDRVARETGAQLLCTSAEVHNPTVVFTPPERREAIAEIARRRGFHILEDDCYRIGPARAASYRSILPDQGWYVSSISKSLTPALRIGFALAPKRHRGVLRRAAEDGFFGLARPLAELTEDLLSQDETYEMMAAVRAEMNRYIRVAVNILGGYDLVWSEEIPFLWLRLPEGWRAASFAQAAEARGVQIRPAEEFALRDANAPHAVRIGVNAQVSLSSFEAAIETLRSLLDNPPERIAI